MDNELEAVELDGRGPWTHWSNAKKVREDPKKGRLYGWWLSSKGQACADSGGLTNYISLDGIKSRTEEDCGKGGKVVKLVHE